MGKMFGDIPREWWEGPAGVPTLVPSMVEGRIGTEPLDDTTHALRMWHAQSTYPFLDSQAFIILVL